MAHEAVNKLENGFEVAQARFHAVLGLSSIKSVDLLRYIDDLEKAGSQLVQSYPNRLGELAEWMVSAHSDASIMNEEGKVEPPFTPEELANIQSKDDTYKRFVGATSAAEKEAPAEQPSQPQRTSDGKS